MTISDNLYKAYDKYENFISEFIRSAMEYGVSFLIVNWKDALGVCQLLNTYTINGVSIAMKRDFVDEAYEDIAKAKENNDNMIITLFGSGEIICEKALEDINAYVDDACYFVEYDAKEVTIPLHAKFIPFKISNEVFENVF